MRSVNLTLSLVALSSTALPPDARAVCTPTVQWIWDGGTMSPTHFATCTTPLVAQLTDDNGDGTIDAEDDTDVVFTHLRPLAHAQITVVDGATGVEHFTIESPEVMLSSLALGDIDGDGIAEFVAIHSTGTRLVAFEHDGTLKWTSDFVAAAWTDYDITGIADLDQDGAPEIYAANYVFDRTGRLRWQGTAGDGGDGSRVPNAIDVIASEPGLELLAGNTLYSATGTVLWTDPTRPDGYTAALDVDGDGDPEIVLAGRLTGGQVTVDLLDHLGNRLAPTYAMTVATGPPSQPVVADLDGDGSPEIVLIDGVTLDVVSFDGTALVQKWSIPVDDPSRGDGAAAFDFHGDGAAELVYHDEKSWYLLSGRDGAVLHVEPFSSVTGIEVPTIANIDRDCATEILVAGCLRSNQVIAYECAGGNSARSIWNQYGYHATNINDDLTIPRVERPPWTQGDGWQQQSAGTTTRAIAAPPADVCGSQPVNLECSASPPCPGLECRWLEGAIVACDWSTATTCVVTPAGSTIYTLEVRCGGACAPIDRAFVPVTVRPDARPDDLGNSLRAIRLAGDVVMSWATAPRAATFNVHRSLVKQSWPAALVTGLTASSVALPDVPTPPSLYHYRAAGVSCSGEVGP